MYQILLPDGSVLRDISKTALVSRIMAQDYLATDDTRLEFRHLLTMDTVYIEFVSLEHIYE